MVCSLHSIPPRSGEEIKLKQCISSGWARAAPIEGNWPSYLRYTVPRGRGCPPGGPPHPRKLPGGLSQQAPLPGAAGGRPPPTQRRLQHVAPGRQASSPPPQHRRVVFTLFRPYPPHPTVTSCKERRASPTHLRPPAAARPGPLPPPTASPGGSAFSAPGSGLRFGNC